MHPSTQISHISSDIHVCISVSLLLGISQINFKYDKVWIYNVFTIFIRKVLAAKGQFISKAIYGLLTSPKMNRQIYFVCFFTLTNKIRPSLFWENLRFANVLFNFFSPLKLRKQNSYWSKNFFVPIRNWVFMFWKKKSFMKIS